MQRKWVVLIAGNGPPPKDPSTRQRRNKVSTKATLRAVEDLPIPDLPARPDGAGWHELTLVWWDSVLSSPMAPEFDASDVHGLYALALLTDDFWRAVSSSERIRIAGELRQQGQRFGLSPIDRRRLQWEIERSEEAQDKGAKRRSGTFKSTNSGGDPRSALSGA